MSCTGGPIEAGAPLVEYGSYADRGAAVLVKLGVNTREVKSVPAPRTKQDRTYTSAVALATWWRDHGVSPTKVHLVTDGLHARRSRLLFEEALGKGVVVGVTAVPNRSYDPQQWWRSSPGVRGVIDESFGYLYARLVFRPYRE
jgi:uncharacterized SAM-binding protein YcdF (DUF218 family)